MSRTTVEEVFDIIEFGEVEVLKAITPQGFDWKCKDSWGWTPLHEVIYLVRCELDHYKIKSYLKLAEWILSQGADPRAQAEEHADNENDDGLIIFDKSSDNQFDDDDDDSVRMFVGGMSPITTAAKLIQDMQRRNDRVEMDLDDDLSIEIDFLQELLKLFCKPTAQSREVVPVDDQVVTRWEMYLHHTASHDVTFEACDGSCTAHAAFCAMASPVLKASLTSQMQEGQHKRIALSDSPTKVVKLLLDLIYVGGTSEDVDAATGLATLELAHRWQIGDVILMTQRLLANLLSVENFEVLANAAQHLKVELLQKACVAFFKGSGVLRRKLKPETASPAIRELLGFESLESQQSGKKRRML